MRYIIFGAGAIGAAIGGQLADAGQDVTLIARGPHLTAMQARGLRLVTAEGELVPDLRVVSSPEEAAVGPNDVVVLAMKSQDTEAAVRVLAATATIPLAVVCAQNGVDNERVALRRGFRTYGMLVILPASHLEPGVVHLGASPVRGILDVGRYPAGSDEVADQLSADLRSASFAARSDPDIMRWKYRKLLINLGNSLEAVCGNSGDMARRRDLLKRMQAEGMACLDAAGIEIATSEEDHERRQAMPPRHAWRRGPGGQSSSWQSLARETGGIEADWLNGEIVLLGREHDVPTPVNAVLQITADRMAWRRRRPGSVPLEEVEQAILRYETQLQNIQTGDVARVTVSACSEDPC